MSIFSDDPGRFLEIVVATVSWLILRFDNKKNVFRIFIEGIILFLMYGIGYFACSSVCQIIFDKFGIYPFHVVLLLIHGTITALYMRICSSYQTKTRWLLWAGLCSVGAGVSAIASQCSFMLSNELSEGVYLGIVRSAIDLLIPLAAVYLRRFNFDDFIVVPGRGFQLILGGLSGIMMLYIVEDAFFGYSIARSITLLTAYIVMLTMIIASIRTMYMLCREQADILELQTEKQRYMADKDMAQFTEKALDDLRCIRHDLKNQYAYMKILLTEERYDELQSYFANMSENLPVQLNTIDCGNRSVNTILNLEMAKIGAEHISFNHRLVVPPVLPIAEEDVCAIIGNILDNAIEECRKLSKAGREDVSIDLDIHPYNSYLLLICNNPTDLKTINFSHGGILTSKKDNRFHGYGTRIVSKLAEKYNGCAEFSVNDGIFSAQVMLDMSKELK